MPRSPQDDRQDAVPAADRRGEAPVYRSARVQQKRRNPLKALVPALILGAFGVVIARQELPGFADWWARTFTPGEWHSRDTCRRAVLAELGGGRYPRLLDGGELHRTRDGPSVTRMRFAVLGDAGEERVVVYNCYLDPEGRVFKLARTPE